ncbi:MAG: hypothetical protein A2583_05965 [Bdellovibrionales bacterium RIFOXYD1_FULL_53_11]|nr:MAG: hypothetical protein A2583_05965 [Bdellovibrionales bacterium RIFOXYD1_FULL_53_11]
MGNGANRAGGSPSIPAKILALVLSPYRFGKAVCTITGLAVILTCTGAGLYAANFFRSLPDFHKITFDAAKERAIRSVHKKRDDKSRKTLWCPISDISRDCIYALVTSEDANYFEHRGVDIDSMLDSLAVNIRKRKLEYGASTISQQVVKNLFLTNEKSFIRKIKELIITERMERAYSKNQILELYLNIAETGRDLYGIREAAQFYFRKKPAALNAAEGAFIAIMLPSPRKHQYTVFENENIAPAKRKRINRILRDMYTNEFISDRQYRQYAHYDYFGAKNKKRGRYVAGE